jgi:hypothetical protein
MPIFAVEVYTARPTHAKLADVVAHEQAAAKAMEGRGDVRYLSSVFLPEDEVCLHLFDGPSSAAVGRAAERVGLSIERVIEALVEERIRQEGGDMR